MKKLIILLIIVCSCVPALNAMGDPDQYLSPEELKAEQQAFITEKTGLTKEETAKLFPVYSELQDRKRQLSDEAWKLLHDGRDDKTTDTQCGEMLEGVYDAHIASNRLDKTYLEKSEKVLSCRKIHLIQRAEMRFHRELLKGARDNERKKK